MLISKSKHNKRLLLSLITISFVFLFISCDNNDDNDSNKSNLYKIKVVNESSYVVTNFFIKLYDEADSNDFWVLATLSPNQSTDFHEFIFTDTESDQPVIGMNACYYGQYTLNNNENEILICYPNLTKEIVLRIQDNGIMY